MTMTEDLTAEELMQVGGGSQPHTGVGPSGG